MTNNIMVTDEAQSTSAILATGSVVQGDWLIAYQTSTDDMFGEVRGEAYTAGSFAVARLSRGASAGLDDSVVGIALNSASSGDSLAVAHKGLFIGVGHVGAGDHVTAGLRVCTAGQGLQNVQVTASSQGFDVGRAFTGASADSKYILFRLNI